MNENEKLMIDKGWKQMSNLLDKEMPLVIKKTTAFGKKVIFILLLMLVSIGGGYYLLNNVQEQKNTKKEKLPPKNNSSVKNGFASLENRTKDNSSFIDNEKITKNKKSEDASNELNSTRDYASEGAKRHSSNAIINQKKSISDSDLSKNIQGYRTNTIKYTLDKKGQEYTEIAISSGLTERTRGLLVVNKLNGVGLHELKNDFVLYYPADFDPVLLSSVPIRRFNKAFSIKLTGISEDFTSFGGVEPGLEYNIDLSDKIGVGLGLDFSYIKKRGMSNSFLTNVVKVSAYDGRYEADKVNRPGSVTTRYYEEFNFSTRNPYTLGGFVDELYYVGLPVSIHYIRKRYRVSIGLRTSYLIYGTNFTANKNYVGGQNYVIYSDEAFINSKVYNRFDYSTFLSFDYLVWKRFSVTAKFNYSFSNILSSPEEQLAKTRASIAFRSTNRYEDRYDNNIYFSLGFKYKL